jgi:ArsR family transcriptional regulator
MNSKSPPQAVLTPGQFERIAKALADPRRFKVLQTIAASGDDCAYQRICKKVPVTKATISHHLKELVQAGLVESVRDGQYVHTCVRREIIEAYTSELLRRTAGAAPGPNTS